MNTRIPTIGILAFGSLINDPGDTIKEATESQIRAKTPFNVEYARCSDKRFGGPTLIPVTDGGASVNAVVFLLKDTITKEQAETMLWLRETGKICGKSKYQRPSTPKRNSVLIESVENFCGIDIVLYTKIARNIDPLTADNLAQHAIQSAKAEAQRTPQDGITYLIGAKGNEIITPLTQEYERAILAATGADSLEAALRSIQADAAPSRE